VENPLFAITLLALSGLLCASAAAQNSELTWDATFKEYPAKPGETKAVIVFNVTNTSQKEIVIRGVSTSCGCAKVTIPSTPWKLTAGADGQVKVQVDFTGKQGVLVKTVIVETAGGLKVLNFRLTIPEAQTADEVRKRNQELATVDRQAVFKGDCAKCHAETARGKMGRELYVAACGICHEAEHRASMVPDLRSLKHPVDRDYWRQWVMQGKPGTLMPAFAKSEGGPLTDEQINSLVEFLWKSK